MIDKFNFYDVYGYFLPGAAVILLFWLPFGLVRNSWPAGDLGSAVIGVVVAYFTGHLLQMVCGKVIPSWIAKGSNGHLRYPSEVVLDQDNDKLAKKFKENLAKLVQKKFDLDLGIDKSDDPEADKARNTAFFLARHLLVQAKEISYGEQFEGLYSLMRGLCAAFALAAVNYLGWSISVFHRRWLDCVVLVVITVSLLAGSNIAAQLLRTDLGRDTPTRLERWSALALLLASLGTGYGMGLHLKIMPAQAAALAFCAMATLMACLRSFAAYKYHCINFALTVWRDFHASTNKEQSPADKLDV